MAMTESYFPSSEFRDPSSWPVKERLTKELKSKGILAILDPVGPEQIAIDFLKSTGKIKEDKPIITTANLYFVSDDEFVECQTQFKLKELESLDIETAAVIVAYSITIGTMVVHIDFEGADPKDLYLHQIFDDSKKSALEALSISRQNKQMEARRKALTRTGLENNVAYNSWEKWLCNKLDKAGLRLITGVDGLNGVITQRIVDKDYAVEKDLSETSTLFRVQTPIKRFGNEDKRSSSVGPRYLSASGYQKKMVRAFLEIHPQVVNLCLYDPNLEIDLFIDAFNEIEKTD